MRPCGYTEQWKMQDNVRDLLRKRKRSVFYTLAGAVLFITALNIGSWYSYFSTRDLLDRQLGAQLEAISATMAQILDHRELRSLASGTDDEYTRFIIRRSLEKVKRANDLEAVFIFDGNLNSLIDTRVEFTQGDHYGYMLSDSLTIQAAWRDGSAHSPLHEIDGSYFKSGYFAIYAGPRTPLAMICSDASADFLEKLAALRTALSLFAVVSVIVLSIVSASMLRSVRALVRAQEEVGKSEKLALVGKMAAGIAHEIRNPLGIIKSTADIIRRNYGTDEDEIFDYIPSEVERVDNLVEGFLSMAREQAPQIERVNASAWLDGTVSRLEPLCREEEVSLNLAPPDSSIELNIDREHSERVLRNLVSNSIAAGREAGSRDLKINIYAGTGKTLIEPDVQSSGHEVENRLVVYVEDNGPGIPESAAENIFEPFFTTRRAGTGLGLAIARADMESQDGLLQLEPSDSGTVFSCWFPLAR